MPALNKRGGYGSPLQPFQLLSCPPGEPRSSLSIISLGQRPVSLTRTLGEAAWVQIPKSCHNPGPVFKPPKPATPGGKAVLTAMHSDRRDAKLGCTLRLCKVTGPRSPVRKGPHRVRQRPVGRARAAATPQTPQVSGRGTGGQPAAGQGARRPVPKPPGVPSPRASPRPAVRAPVSSPDFGG